MKNLERFGIYSSADQGRIERIDPQKTLETVTAELASAFDFEPHHGIFFLAQTPEGKIFLRELFARKKEVLEVERDAVEVEEGSATCVYLHEERDVRYPCDYAVFVGKVSPGNFAPYLGEEVLHGEHICFHKIDQQMSDYEWVFGFHELSNEFLGYMGRLTIERLIGRQFSYNAKWINLCEEPNEREFAHLLAYFALEKFWTDERIIPLSEFFHLKNEGSLWQRVLKEYGGPIELPCAVSPNISLETIQKRIDRILLISQAEEAIKVVYSLKES